jgi:hypothetical protein
MNEDNNDDGVKIKSSFSTEELLRQKIIDSVFKAVEYGSEGKLRYAFETFKTVRAFIVSYEYSNKAYLDELEEILSEYFENLKNPASYTRKDLIKMRDQQQYELNKLLDDYKNNVFRAFTELDLWLKVVVKRNDFDKVLSDENFNSDYTGIDKKKKELATLNSDYLLNLLTVNQIHDAYSKYLFIKMVEEKEEDS